MPKHLLTEKSTVLFVYDCASKCLLLSEHKCMSFNYHSKGACELMGAIEGHDHKVAVVSLSAIAVGIVMVMEMVMVIAAEVSVAPQFWPPYKEAAT